MTLLFCVKWRGAVVIDSIRVFPDRDALVAWLKEPDLADWIEGRRFVYKVGSAAPERLSAAELRELGLR